MRSNWRWVVHEFIKQQNRVELEGRIDDLIPFIHDERYIEAEAQRLSRMNDTVIHRAIKKQSNEVKFRIINVAESHDHIKVNFCLQRRNYYEQKGKSLAEDKIQYERMILHKVRNRWEITSCTASQPERSDIGNPENRSKSQRIMTSKPLLNPAVLPRSALLNRKTVYDREAVAQYADTWWDMGNPEFKHFDVDCTNFVSQCLYAGDIPMDYTNKKNQGWWYRKQNGDDQWSLSWSVSHSLNWYLADPQSVFQAEKVENPDQLDIGDVITYDWDGDGKFQHSTIVAAKDAQGMPLVNAHTQNSKHRFWDYKDSYAWSEQTRYNLFHITD